MRTESVFNPEGPPNWGDDLGSILRSPDWGKNLCSILSIPDRENILHSIWRVPWLRWETKSRYESPDWRENLCSILSVPEEKTYVPILMVPEERNYVTSWETPDWGKKNLCFILWVTQTEERINVSSWRPLRRESMLYPLCPPDWREKLCFFLRFPWQKRL